jgi:glutamate/tyrosine decarboxylase-like PLP-dependent enzyme
MRIFFEDIIPTIRAQGHPTNLAYVPGAPSPAALAFDAALGSSGIFGGTWEAGSGAIHAENQAIAWLADCAGFPETAGGVFVSGGTVGNLSALHAARKAKRANRPEGVRLAILASSEAHSSIKAVADVMDVDLIVLPVDENGMMLIDALRETDCSRAFAIVANAGATNSGAVDDIAALADFSAENDLWLHLDGAYGLAALACPTNRKTFDGIQRADSFIVDPHKWLFAPYDVCALVYRNPAQAADAHAQRAVYLDPINKDNWNPTDYAMHLSRRARGLPLWFSLAVYGADAYGAAIAQCVDTTRAAAAWMEAQDFIDVSVVSKLGVVLFRPNHMSDDQIDAWSDRHREDGTLLCTPTSWNGVKHLRICVVNPATTVDMIVDALATLK